MRVTVRRLTRAWVVLPVSVALVALTITAFSAMASTSRPVVHGRSVPRNAIALVAGTPVLRSALTHVQAVLTRAGGTSAVEQLVSGDASYRACAHSVLQHGHGSHADRVQTAQRFCAQARSITTTNRQALRREAIQTVIEEAWLSSASTAQHALPTPQAISRGIATIRHALGAGRYQHLVTRLGVTTTDIKDYIAAQLEIHALGLTTPAAGRRFLDRWAKRTSCVSGLDQSVLCRRT